MILTAILVGFFVFLGQILAVLVAIRLVKAAITRAIVRFITKPSENTPSPLVELINMVAIQTGGQVSASLKAAFMGIQSVDSKAERKAMAQAVISGNSLLNAFVQSFPAVGKKLSKNPMLAGLADMAIDKFTNKSAPAQESSVKFKL